MPPLERDILAHAVNERLDEITWTHRARYSRAFRDSTPRSAPFAALIHLLEGSEFAPPDRLPGVVAAAAEALGVTLTVHLVDYEQRCLHPLPPDDGAPALDVETTLAGRAYRQVRVLAAETPGRPRLWVPLVDGVERLGVLEVGVEDPEDLYDPGLRTQCRWSAMLIAHLVTLLDQYGDGVDRARLRRHRSVNAELIWSLLPPLTAGVDRFVVSGALEPRHGVSGDAFDYALSETTATLIVLDAVGNDLRSGLITAAALAAHRSARHAGHGLVEQAAAIDRTIARQFGDTASATAVLAELDLATGRLRYLNAGHPAPLVLRSGEVVKRLTAGRCPPLGQGVGEPRVAEVVLEPDDWLVLYTDGVTEAGGARGEPFGEHGLADFLRREATAGNPPPETARRLVKAVLDHHHGTLQDDATVLLARWTSPDHVTR
ncbi:PP2C family protein-serine/threonine phosphatase [Saccharothrix variisporea]|uniref:PP2C family protein-serine/threonine phosphatase n=1 Tax=Saccharothrix variisporea TaxID=543527 RepID=UPI001FE9A526|nr:PP2C family protein-serine/threonine phosphatase [Saccharothrix variisporea]